MMRYILGLVLMISLAACSEIEQPSVNIPVHEWAGIRIRIETHPEPVRAGMNEFVVIINDQLKGIRPAHDYIVSLRTSAQFPWRQAIQDGHSGVYRRAIALDKVENAVLQMHIEKDDSATTLRFLLDPVAIQRKNAQ